MIVKGKVEYKKAIILNRERMRQLDSLLQTYCCNKVMYTVTLINGRKEEYENCEDLLQADNYGENRIVSLDIRVHAVFESESITITIGSEYPLSFFFSYSCVCVCMFSFKDKHKADEFEQQLNLILNKSKATYWAIAKVDANTIIYLLSLFYVLYSACSGKLFPEFVNIPAWYLMTLIFATVLFLICIRCFDKMLHRTILPKVSFEWGEETQRSMRMEKIRGNVFWCVIIAMIVGIVAGIVSGEFMNLLLSSK